MTTAAEAVQQMINGMPPDYTYLLRNVFRVLVSRNVTTAREAQYYGVDVEGLLRFQSTPYGSTYATITAFLIPVTPGKPVFTNGSFPTGSFYTVDLACTADLRVLCTEQLTGCTMAFGWDSANRRLYVGHVEPDGDIPEISTRAKLCEYLRTNAAFTGFQGVELDRASILFVGGSRPCWSDYDGDTANVVGFLYQNKVRLIVQVVMSNNRIRESWTLDFPVRRTSQQFVRIVLVIAATVLVAAFLLANYLGPVGGSN